MKSATALFLLALSLPVASATPCRENIDCRQPGTRCVNAHYPLIAFCGPWHVKDAPGPRMGVLGEHPSKTPPAKRNDAVSGPACRSDSDCASGQACVRPNTNAAWRCVAR